MRKQHVTRDEFLTIPVVGFEPGEFHVSQEHFIGKGFGHALYASSIMLGRQIAQKSIDLVCGKVRVHRSTLRLKCFQFMTQSGYTSKKRINWG